MKKFLVVIFLGLKWNILHTGCPKSFATFSKYLENNGFLKTNVSNKSYSM